MPVYLVDTLGIEQSTADTASTVSLFIYMLAIFVMGAISDRHGRKKMLVLASILFIVLTVPLFLLFKQPGLPVAMVIGITVVFSLILTVNDGTLPTFLAEIFPTQVRYSGFALSFNAANAFLGGTAPLVATSLIAATDVYKRQGWCDIPEVPRSGYPRGGGSPAQARDQGHISCDLPHKTVFVTPVPEMMEPTGQA